MVHTVGARSWPEAEGEGRLHGWTERVRLSLYNSKGKSIKTWEAEQKEGKKKAQGPASGTMVSLKIGKEYSGNHSRRSNLGFSHSL